MSVRPLNSDISPVPVSELVDDRTGKPVETQANQIPKSNKKETTIELGNLCHSDTGMAAMHENVRQPVVNRDKNHERSGRPDMNRDTHD